MSLAQRARLAAAGLLVLCLLGSSIRSFLAENLSVIQRLAANPVQPYDSKVDVRWNDFSRFMRFIADHTPETAVIMFPTGGKTGFYIERRSLAGFFLYPRQVVSGDSLAPSLQATHVVTADGAPSFAVSGERSVFTPGRINDETVRALKGQRDIRLTVYGLRLLDEAGAVVASLDYSDAASQVARRTGGRATRTTRAHEIVAGPYGMGEVFDFQFREPTDFDVWRLPIDLETRAGQRTDLEVVYALRDPGVSLTLEAAQTGGAVAVVEPLLADPSGRPRTLRLTDLSRRFQERGEASRGGALGSRIRFEARLLFTPAVEAVYPDVGLIEVAPLEARP